MPQGLTRGHARQRVLAAGTAAAITVTLMASGPSVGPTFAAPGDAGQGPPVSVVPVASLVRKTPLSTLSPPAPDSSGIVYRSDVDRLLLVDSEVNEMPLYQGVNLWQLTRTGDQQDTGTTLGFSKEPTGVTYDPVGRRLFISDDDRERVFEVTAGPDDRFGTADDVVTWFSTLAMGNDDAEDVAYDTTTGDLFVTQGNAQEIWRVSPGPNGRFDGIAPTGDDTFDHFDVAVYGSRDVEGLAYYPVRDSLFLADRKLKEIIEVSTSGDLMQRIDVSGIRMRQPAGITLGPSSVDPSVVSFYVVVRGRDNNNHPDENDGVMFELSGGDLGPVPPNAAPVVDAGPDRTVVLPTSAILDGRVTDDGRPDPPGTTTVTWTALTGPAPVVFAHPRDEDTVATFTAPGTYVLRLGASDSSLTSTDTTTVVVTGTPTAPPTCQGRPARAQYGPASDDVLRGTGRVDDLRGGRGADELRGRGGSDCLDGGPGRDVLTGGAGADLLVGGGGRDRLRAGPGRDRVIAGGGDDLVVTVDGKKDVVRCGSGKDTAVVDRHDRVSATCERVRRSP